MSYGSAFGVNAFVGKLSYAIRLGSVMGKREGWFAERCVILAVTSPEGKKHYVCAAFPLGCGKTNFAMLVPTIPGWTVRCVGDDVAWLHVGDDGRLYAINPEAGFFDVAPGTSDLTNRSAMQALNKNTIFTNVALTSDGDVWWEGMTKTPPADLVDWTGQKWNPECGREAAHPNSRYTTPATQCPVIDPDWENPNGVPISGIIFGGRRVSTVPLVSQAFTWEQGVLMGATIATEHVKEGRRELNREPFAMHPLCGYNMADYFNHWIDMRANLGYNAPKIFLVNWFRKDSEGHYLWPGFDENSRVLKWIVQRLGNGKKIFKKCYIDFLAGQAVRTPLGLMPPVSGLDLRGVDVSKESVTKALDVSTEEWLREVDSIESYLAQFGSTLTPTLKQELASLKERFLTPTNNH
jgi:phosphoenolpyruvate carboxykinase (GTP)